MDYLGKASEGRIEEDNIWFIDWQADKDWQAKDYRIMSHTSTAWLSLASDKPVKVIWDKRGCSSLRIAQRLKFASKRYSCSSPIERQTVVDNLEVLRRR